MFFFDWKFLHVCVLRDGNGAGRGRRMGSSPGPRPAWFCLPPSPSHPA